MARISHVIFLGLSCAMAAGCGVEDAENEMMSDANEGVVHARQREVISCPVDASSVVFNKTLVITHTSVVEDPCRTKWNPGVTCATSTQRKWHFWYLMQKMAGTNDVTKFVLKMLESIDSWPTPVPPPPLNGMLLQRRTRVRDFVIDSWMRKTNTVNNNSNCVLGKSIDDPLNASCQLDPASTPLRLLAIVNRVDARKGTGGVNAYYNSDTGEGRFVFGFFNWDDLPSSWVPSGQPNAEPRFKNAVIILEYKLPVYSPQSWATMWNDLGSSTAFDENYNIKLQSLTDKFSLNGYQMWNPSTGTYSPYGPNNSTVINRVRVNEIDFDQGRVVDGVSNTKVWSLREFKLDCLPGQTCSEFANNKFLLPNPVAQTPANTSGNTTPFNYNETQALQDFMTSKRSEILAGTHEVPQSLANGSPFLGAESTSRNIFNGEPILWMPASWDVSTQRDVRRFFAFSTCNGCHYRETQTDFFHIKPRNVGQASLLSPFLQGPITTSNDPSGDQFDYDEPARRKCELAWLKAGNGTPVSTVVGRPH